MVRYRRYHDDWHFAREHIRQHEILEGRLGPIVSDIETCFFCLNRKNLNDLLDRYGQKYGSRAKSYAQKTYPKWKSGNVQLSGQTSRRLLKFVPSYLSSIERFDIVRRLCEHHAPTENYQIQIDRHNPSEGLYSLKSTIEKIVKTPPLKHLPEHVIQDVNWLNDDDVTAARQMLSEVDRLINRTRLEYAKKEIKRFHQILQDNEDIHGEHKIILIGGTIVVIFKRISFWKKLFRRR